MCVCDSATTCRGYQRGKSDKHSKKTFSNPDSKSPLALSAISGVSGFKVQRANHCTRIVLNAQRDKAIREGPHTTLERRSCRANRVFDSSLIYKESSWWVAHMCMHAASEYHVARLGSRDEVELVIFMFRTEFLWFFWLSMCSTASTPVPSILKTSSNTAPNFGELAGGAVPLWPPRAGVHAENRAPRPRFRSPPW